jgi:hypothetical protein
MPITEKTRILIFNKLKKNLEKFTPPMVVTIDSSNSSYEIIGNKPVPYGYNKKIVPGMFFASLAQRKDSVTFHFFPLYMDTKLIEVAPSLNKFLKGKTCFHFNKEEQINEKELTLLLEKGMIAWKKSGYMI